MAMEYTPRCGLHMLSTMGRCFTFNESPCLTSRTNSSHAHAAQMNSFVAEAGMATLEERVAACCI